MTQKKFTKQEIIDEFKKCGRDPVYFLKTYAKITHPDRGLIPFETHKFQEDIIEAYLNNKKNIILKSRQIGVSTITGGFCAWLMLFRRQQNIIVLANKREVSTVMVKIVKTIVNNLPPWFSQLVRVTTRNVNSIGLSNGSIIKALANTANAGRSEAVSFLVVDEAAAIEKFEDLWAAVSPTTSQGGRIAVLSTPKGQGSFFHKMYEQAKAGDNGFNCTYGTYVNPENPNEVYNDRFMWWVYPTYTKAWFEAETRGKSPKLIAQEYCCFDGDTRVFTETGLRKISEIKIGDKVLTHKGNFKKVIATNNREASDVYRINTQKNRIFTTATSEHPILDIYRNWKSVESFNVNEKAIDYPRHINFFNKEKYIVLKDIINNDCFSIKEEAEKIYINDRRFKARITNKIEIDYDLGKLLGLYLAEGCCGKNYITFSFNYKKELNTWVKDIIDIFNKKFGLSSFNIRSKNNTGIIQFNSKLLKLFIDKLTSGKDCYTKCMSSFAYSVGNKEFFKGIIDGLFIGDGCLEKKYVKTFSSVSENLSYDLKYLLTICDFGDFSFRKQEKNKKTVILNRNVNQADCYVIKLLRTKDLECENVSKLKQKNIKENLKHLYGKDDHYNFTTVINKESVSSVVVYNIEVEDDHSYVTEHFTVHNCDFAASGDTFLENETIKRLDLAIREPISKLGFDRNLWIFENPIPGGMYVISCDVSSGNSDDFSAFHVLRMDGNFKQCAEYKGKITPDVLGDVLVDAAKMYNNAVIATERNAGWAGQTIMKINLLGYPFLYYSPKSGAAGAGSVDVYTAQLNDMQPGYVVTSLNRVPMLAKLEEILRLNHLEISSSRTVAELKTFIYNNGRPEAMKGFNDDLVMSLAGGCWVHDESYAFQNKNSDLAKALINGILTFKRDVSSYSQFNQTNSQYTDYRVLDYTGKNIRVPSAEKLDFSWLLPKIG